MARHLPKMVSDNVKEMHPAQPDSETVLQEPSDILTPDAAEERLPPEPPPTGRWEEPRSYFSAPSYERRSARDWEDEARKHPTLLIHKTLRSGQHVRFYGNVVVLGDVNPGAEIIAGGDIIVMGWLRGMAQAGSDGSENAMIAAFRLNPTQIRIAHYIGRAPDGGDSSLPAVPEFAEVREGRLVIDQWQHSMLGNSK